MMVPVTAASAPAAAGGLAGLGWVIGCAPLVAELAEAWTVWMVRCTMPVAAWAAGADGADGVWTVWPVLAAVLAAAAGALVAVLAAAWLAGLGWVIGCAPPPEPWAAADPCEAAADPCEAAADPCEAAPSDDPLAPVGPGRAGIEPERAGIWVANAGRAKIRARIKASMKAAARPPQAYRHTRRVQAPTLASPTLEWMATFPSTARKPRQTLCYVAITHPVRRAPVTSSLWILARC